MSVEVAGLLCVTCVWILVLAVIGLVLRFVPKLVDRILDTILR